MQPRERMLERLAGGDTDLVVIGGGANGAGIALDAAARGLSVALFERGDYASGTSSRSSKLIHGGVRYVALGHFGLVREALAERAHLLANAPALVEPLRFLIPAESRFDLLKYALGVRCYDWLASAGGRRASRRLSAAEIRRRVPALGVTRLRGAVAYDDARFDDARLVVTLIERAQAHGALTLNHAEVIAVRRRGGGPAGSVVVHDRIGGGELEVAARVIVNAGGPYGDSVRTLEDAGASPTLTPSQGAHLVLPRRFLGGDDALVMPRTADGRIMFAIPWYGHVLLGTTDTPLASPPREPRALATEIDAILEVAADFLQPAPTRADVLSVFAGLRPLAGVPDGAPTARRSREHALDVSTHGLVSVSGGKWTTYRLIAEQAVDLALRTAALEAPPSPTASLELAPLHPAAEPRFAPWAGAAPMLAALVEQDPTLGEPLHPALPYCGAHFVWAARAEGAQTVTDALAYRTRALFLNAAAAADIAPQAARLMAAELGRDAAWMTAEVEAARALAAHYTAGSLT